MQPSGKLHMGNYLGALRQWVDMSASYDSMFMVADYHALTSLRKPDELRDNVYDLTADFIAAGIDPAKSIIFQQSAVPEHAELSWIFQCLVSVSFLQQAHAYKDKTAKGLEANAGLFAYPMLMAADILLYDTDAVPVGQDQRQHVEYAREAAAKFNLAFGETFKEPKEKVLESVAVVPGTDGKKMSKSYGNTIPLFGTKDEIVKAVMGIVTDSGGESPSNVYNIHRLIKDESALAPVYKANKGNYRASKEALIADIESMVAPMRERRESLTHEDIKQILQDGGERARERAVRKMADVRQKIGVTL